MHHRSLLKLGIPLMVTALGVAACGSRGSNGSGGSTDQVVKIGVIVPLSGSLSSQGVGIENSVKLAVDEANAAHTVPGVTFQVEAEDDQATASVSQQAAETLINDSQVLGIVGTQNSSTAQADLPNLQQANLLMVSPANTNPTLTQGKNWQTSKSRQYTDYFRVATTDAIQGPYAAQYVYNTLHITKVATVDDQQTYGVGLVSTFTSEFQKLGGQIVDTDAVQVGQKDFSATAQKVKTSGAQMLYYGGQYAEAGPLSAQLKQAGANIPLMGGDAIDDPTYEQLGGASVTGDYATTVGAPVGTGTTVAFKSDYEKANGGADTYSTYGALAFDATNSIIDAVKAAKSGSGLPTRQQVTTAEQGVSFNGATGPVAFDQYGDTTNKVLTILQVKSGAWATLTSGAFQG